MAKCAYKNLNTYLKIWILEENMKNKQAILIILESGIDVAPWIKLASPEF